MRIDGIPQVRTSGTPVHDGMVISITDGISFSQSMRGEIVGGEPGLDGGYHICGFSGHGFMLGPAAGKRMAAHILTGEPDDIIASLSLDRFDNGDLQADAVVVG